MKYDLVGIDGNAFAVMGYTAKALKNEGLQDKVPEFKTKAMAGDYYNLISTCVEYIDLANEQAKRNEAKALETWEYER